MRIMRFIILLLLLIPTSVLATDGDDLTEVLGIRIAQDVTLADIQKRVGQAQLVETGEAVDSDCKCTRWAKSKTWWDFLVV